MDLDPRGTNGGLLGAKRLQVYGYGLTSAAMVSGGDGGFGGDGRPFCSASMLPPPPPPRPEFSDVLEPATATALKREFLLVII